MNKNLEKIKFLNKNEKNAISKFLKELSNHFKDNLISVILFGSKSRGDYDKESDIDLLIILKQIDSFRKINKYLSKIESDLCLKYGPSISSYFVTQEYYKNAQSIPFIKSITREGARLWG